MVILAILIVVLFSLGLFFSSNRPSEKKTTPSPSPTLNPIINDNYDGPKPNSNFQTYTKETKKKAAKEEKIRKFFKKVPIETEDFTLTYSYSDNSFTLNYLEKDKTNANFKFDQLLKDNGIEERDWLYNLKVVEK